MPAIIDAWFRWSENTSHPGNEFRMVESAAWFDTKPEVNSSAAAFPLQRRQLRLQRVVRRAGAADVARASRARAHCLRRRARRLDHHGMAAHAQIVVGRPDQDLGAIRAQIQREAPCLLAQRREAPVAALRLDGRQAVPAMV